MLLIGEFKVSGDNSDFLSEGGMGRGGRKGLWLGFLNMGGCTDENGVYLLHYSSRTHCPSCGGGHWPR